MKVLYGSSLLSTLDHPIKASVVTIGNFDGCHIGHQLLIKKNKTLADNLEAKCLVLSFNPNPKQFFQPNLKIGKLFGDVQKIRALTELDIDILFIQKFDDTFSKLTPDEFYKKLLVDTLHARAIVVGEDFRFGMQRSGNIELLKSLAQMDHIQLEIIPQQTINNQIISSSEIRKLLQESNINLVNSLLGRPYLLEGEVIHGKKLGRQLGFPTANLKTYDQLLPHPGVYAGFAVISENPTIFRVASKAKPAIINVGFRPTVDEYAKELLTEVHLIEPELKADSLYGKHMGVYFTHHIRNEKKFNSLDELKHQLGKDKKAACYLLNQGTDICKIQV